ncbi:MAG TPA: acetate--CoA ligase family protein [Amycolatopsis sp.]|nr:acetate--CoA ligase family protein [Amycolatopsis sp.]
MVLPEFERRAPLVAPGRLRRFFGSRSIAVVGASSTSNWAKNFVANVDLGGVKQLTFVHPKHPELFGRRTVPNLRDLTEPVDLVFVMVGPARVESVLEDAAAVGAKSAVVLASGFGETGEEGVQRQRHLAERAVELDIAILGPNTVGYINPVDGIAAWSAMMAATPLAGPVGAVFESGSMARATFEFARAHGVGTSLWASVGNSAVVTSLDVVDYLIEDDATRAIALFLEAVREPDRLLEVGHRALAAGKPIVAFKAGRSEEGKRSAQAHTGAVATDDVIVDGALRQAGIVRVDSIEELVSTTGLLAYSKRIPRGRRMGVVTSSGGGCNIIADLAAEKAIELPPWESRTVAALRAQLPDFASVLNPLDTTGFGHARARPRPTKAEDDLMEIAVDDPGIDFMYSMMTPLPAEKPEDPTAIESRMRIIGGIVENSPVPVFLSSNTCLDLAPYTQKLLSDNGLYLLPGGELAMSSIGHMLRWRDLRDQVLAAGKPAAPAPAEPGRYPGPAGAWSEARGRDVLRDHDVPLVPAVLARSEAEAIAAWQSIGGSCALKVCSPDITHKSDVGGVALGVDSAEVAASTYPRIVGRARKAVPGAAIEGVLVSPMRPPGVELLVGITVDATFGPVLAVGLGGLWVEVLKDVSVRMLPVDAATVRTMLGELKGRAVLTGERGQDAVDLDATAEVVVRIAQAALSLGSRLESLEVNPLRVTAGGPEVLDVVVITR